MPSLNGTVGFVQGYDAKSDRYMVLVDDGTTKKFKRGNLVLEEEIDNDEGENEEECDESDDRLCGSGIECHEKLNIGRMTDSSLSAAPAYR